MRVAYVTMQLPSPSETFACADVRTLSERGVDVTVYGLRPAHRDHNEMVRDRRLGNVVIHMASPLRVLRGLLTVLSRPRWTLSLLSWTFHWHIRRPDALVRSLILAPSSLAIFRDIHEARFDVVHLFWGHYPAMVGHLVDRFAPSTVLTTFLGAYDLTSRFAGGVDVAQRAAVTWTHAFANLDLLEDRGVPLERVQVVHRGIDLSHTRRIATNDALARVRHRVMVAGRLIPSKGADIALSAFLSVLKTVPDASLCVVGDGPERGELQALAAVSTHPDTIAFLGHVPHDEVLREMARSDVFLMLSSKEGERLPNVVKEAMAMGCVCIVSKTPGIEELVEDDVTGIVLPDTTIDTVATRLRSLMMDTLTLDRLRRAAHAHVTQGFDVTRAMDTYIATWAQLLSNRPHGEERDDRPT